MGCTARQKSILGYSNGGVEMKRLDFWLAKLKVALTERKFIRRRMNQSVRAFENNTKQIETIQEKIDYEKAKLASIKRKAV
jgi:hypothetical protein